MTKTLSEYRDSWPITETPQWMDDGLERLGSALVALIAIGSHLVVPLPVASASRRGLREIECLVALTRPRTTATSRPVETKAVGPQAAEA
jgi:hypothetical protein